MLARSSPTCPTFVLRSSSEPERARPVDVPGVYSSVLFSRILNDSPLRALVGVPEFVAVEDILPSEEVEAGKHTRDPTRLRVHGVFPVGVLGRRPLAKAVLRAPSLRTGEANLDTSRCADDGHGDSLHHPCWRQYLLCPFAQRFLKGILSVLDMYIWCATWYFRWVDRTNSSAPLLRVGKQMVLTAGYWKARLESPPQNLGGPSLCRRRVRARKLGVRDPTI